MTLMASRELKHLVAEKGPRVERRIEVLKGLFKKRCVPAEHAVLQVRGRDRHVRGSCSGELLSASYRSSHREAELPQGGRKARDRIVLGRREFDGMRREDQEVDVGIGKELPASVAADGNKRQILLGKAGCACQCYERPIERRRVARQIRASFAVRFVLGFEAFAFRTERVEDAGEVVGEGVHGEECRLEVAARECRLFFRSSSDLSRSRPSGTLRTTTDKKKPPGRRGPDGFQKDAAVRRLPLSRGCQRFSGFFHPFTKAGGSGVPRLTVRMS